MIDWNLVWLNLAILDIALGSLVLMLLYVFKETKWRNKMGLIAIVVIVIGIIGVFIYA